MNHQHRIDTMAAKLCIRTPFIGTIFSGMQRTIEDVGTACVKGMHAKFDPEFMDKLNDEELLFVVFHETMHTALLHSYRVGDRDGGLWNVAADAVINPEAIRAGYTMPKGDDGKPLGILYNWVKEDMDAETVYKKLLEKQEQEKQEQKGKGGRGDGQPKGGWGDSGDLEADDGAEGDEDSEAEVKVLITQAARTAFASGDKSALVQRVLGAVKQADVDWKDELRTMLSDPSRNDYSYRRYSRRFIGGGLYLPSLYSEDLGVLGVGIDTSGSMTEQQLAQIQAELRTIIEDCAPEKTIVVYCDSSINSVEEFSKGEEVKLVMQGGGGTDMRKITTYFEGVEDRLAGVVIFSDLYTPFPDREPPYPLLWGAVGADRGFHAPVGRTVEVRV